MIESFSPQSEVRLLGRTALLHLGLPPSDGLCGLAAPEGGVLSGRLRRKRADKPGLFGLPCAEPSETSEGPRRAAKTARKARPPGGRLLALSEVRGCGGSIRARGSRRRAAP